MLKELSQPNNWGYQIPPLFGPDMSQTGLTYSFSLLATVRNIKVKDPEEAEKIFFEVYKKNLTILNSVRILRPFLGEFPLTPDGFKMTLGFDDANGDPLLPPYIASISMNEQKIHCCRYSKGENYPFLKFTTKNFQDIIDSKYCYHPALRRCPAKVKPKVPTYASIPERHSSPSDKVVYNFAREFGLKSNLNVVALGNVCKDFDFDAPFEIAFWGNQQLTLKDARMLGATLSDQFLRLVQTNEVTLKRMQEGHANVSHPLDAAFPEARHIALRLSFWDENIDRQPEPYIAEIRLHGGKFTYYTADENQFLVPVLEEALDDAQAFSKEDSPK
jgi:hypothetical protein